MFFGTMAGLTFFQLTFITEGVGLLRWLGKDMQQKCLFFSFSRLFIFLTFFCFVLVFPTFHFRFSDFSLPFSKLFTSGSEKSGKRK